MSGCRANQRLTRMAPSSSVAGRTSSSVEPGQVALRLAVLALAEEQDVDHDVGAGVGAEAAFRQADRADEIGHAGDVLARAGIRLVHRAVRRDEGGEAARLQPVDRLGDEISHAGAGRASGRRGSRADRAIGEGRIADRQVEVRRQIGAREIAGDDPRPRLQQPGDARRDGIELDAGDVRDLAQRLRHQRRKQAGADRRARAHGRRASRAAASRPDRPDDELRREVGILGAARERGVVGIIDRILQIGADLVPALRELGLRPDGGRCRWQARTRRSR